MPADNTNAGIPGERVLRGREGLPVARDARGIGTGGDGQDAPGR
jgi:hypothetical protein